MDRFDLIDEDYQAILIAKNVARRFLKLPLITLKQIICLGNALDALERLPNVTSDASVEYGIWYRNGDDNFEEMEYIFFRITDDEFQISRGGSTYSKSVGGETISRPGWSVELGGYYERDCNLSHLESTIAEYINLGAEMIVKDEQ
jgi:hypothetical protein